MVTFSNAMGLTMPCHSEIRGSVAAAVLLEAQRSFQLTSAMDELRVDADGVGYLQLSSWDGFVQTMNVLARPQDNITAVIIDATRTEHSLEAIHDCLGMVRALSGVCQAAKLLASLPVPTCTLLDGSVSALAAIVAMMCDHRLGTAS
eukprot:396055-Rhodomonas_salina.1